MFLFSPFFLTAEIRVESSAPILVKMLTGTSILYSNGKKIGLVLTQKRIEIGMVVETLSGSKGQIFFQDKTEFRLKQNTKVQILHNGIRLNRGHGWMNFVREGKDFVVQTPSLFVGITGTEIDMACNGKKLSDVQVFKGRVACWSPENPEKKINLEQGLALATLEDGALGSPQFFDVESARKEWLSSDWKGTGKSDPEKAYEAFVQLMKEPATSHLAAEAYKEYEKIQHEYQKRLDRRK